MSSMEKKFLKACCFPQHQIIRFQESRIIMKYIGMVCKTLGFGHILLTDPILQMAENIVEIFFQGGCTVFPVNSTTGYFTLDGW